MTGAHWSTVDSLPCSRNQFEMSLSFVTWHFSLFKAGIRRWVHCAHKKIYSGRLWYLNGAQLVWWGAKKLFATSLNHHHWQLDRRHNESMLSCCFRQILTLLPEGHTRYWDSSHWANFFQSSVAHKIGKTWTLKQYPIYFKVQKVVHSEKLFCILWL